MEKTDEGYTAARLQLLAKSQAHGADAAAAEPAPAADTGVEPLKWCLRAGPRQVIFYELL